MKADPAEDLIHAVDTVKNKIKRNREAEEYYQDPKAVIYNRIAGRKTSMSTKRADRSKALSPEIENEIEQCLLTRTKIGVPCDKFELRNFEKNDIPVKIDITPL